MRAPWLRCALLVLVCMTATALQPHSSKVPAIPTTTSQCGKRESRTALAARGKRNDDDDPNRVRSLDEIDASINSLLNPNEGEDDGSARNKKYYEYKSAEEFELESKLLQKDIDNVRVVRKQVKEELSRLSKRLSPSQRRRRNAGAFGGALTGFSVGMYAAFVLEVDLQFIEPIILVPVLTTVTSLTVYGLSSPRGAFGELARSIFGDTTIAITGSFKATSRGVADDIAVNAEMSAFRAQQEIVNSPKIAKRVIRESLDDAKETTMESLENLKDDIIDFPRYVTETATRKAEETQQRLMEVAQRKAKETKEALKETGEALRKIPSSIADEAIMLAEDIVDEAKDITEEVVTSTKSSIDNTIESTHKKVDNTVTSTAATIISTPTKIKDGIKDKSNSLANAVESEWNATLKQVEDFQAESKAKLDDIVAKLSFKKAAKKEAAVSAIKDVEPAKNKKKEESAGNFGGFRSPFRTSTAPEAVKTESKFNDYDNAKVRSNEAKANESKPPFSFGNVFMGSNKQDDRNYQDSRPNGVEPPNAVSAQKQQQRLQREQQRQQREQQQQRQQQQRQMREQERQRREQDRQQREMERRQREQQRQQRQQERASGNRNQPAAPPQKEGTNLLITNGMGNSVNAQREKSSSFQRKPVPPRNNNNNNNRPNDAFNAGPRPPLSVVDGPDRSQTGNTSPNNNVQRSGTMGRPAQTVKTGSSNRKRKRGNKVNQRKSSSTKDVNGRSNDQSDDANNKPAEPNAFFSDFANGRSSTDDFYSDDDDDDEDRQNRQRSFFLNNNNNNNNNGYDGSNDGPDPTRDERPRPSIPMPNSFRE